MSVKYHLSPDTGRPNICRAQQSCPIGTKNEHFNSKDEAREAFESKMTSETFKPVSKKNSKLIENNDSLSEEKIMDWEAEIPSIDELDDSSVDFNKVEAHSIDDDFSDIKCDDCSRPLNSCICDLCGYCGSDDPEWHEDDCRYANRAPKAYSWD